jgi:hypothetical protein
VRRLGDTGTGPACLFQDGVDFFPAVDVMAEAALGQAGSGLGQAGVPGEVAPFPQREQHAVL